MYKASENWDTLIKNYSHSYWVSGDQKDAFMRSGTVVALVVIYGTVDGVSLNAGEEGSDRDWDQ